jgi:hypothetical protein
MHRVFDFSPTTPVWVEHIFTLFSFLPLDLQGIQLDNYTARVNKYAC